MAAEIRVSDVIEALDAVTGGRVVTGTEALFSGKNPFVVCKTSHIPGKAVVETPGLVYGNPDQLVRRIAMVMTLTESGIELAGSIGIDLLIAHHPVADAANSGGVPLKTYLDLYNLSVIELHEAFHGLHPGIPYLHGHKPFRVDVAYGGLPGNIVFVGKALEEVATVRDLVDRLIHFMGGEEERELLDAERQVRGCQEIQEASVAAGPQVVTGHPESTVGTILHIFPHTGFSPEHLEKAISEHPEIDTIIASISRVGPGHPLAVKAKELGRNFLVGNTHAIEIYENWLPLSEALSTLFPSLEIVLFRERVSAIPLDRVRNEAIRRYAREMAGNYLLPRARERR
ncbi:MAG: NGG1p interacting factor NIF3 [Bacillota bacterium]